MATFFPGGPNTLLYLHVIQKEKCNSLGGYPSYEREATGFKLFKRFLK